MANFFERPLANNLVSLFLNNAKIAGDKGITYITADKQEIAKSYNELLNESSRYLTGLRSSGLKAGDHVILQIDNQHQFFWFFGHASLVVSYH